MKPGTELANQNDVPAWMAKMRAAMFNAVKESDITEIMAGVVERAKKGDAQAVKIVMEYIVGANKPPHSQTNVLIQQSDAPQPAAPTRARIGTRAKVEVMAERARNGQSLHHPDDE